ncbi:MAG: hypothetical protein ACKKL6_02430 [Candidatus Komeilibacteria bacterium]
MLNKFSFISDYAHSTNQLYLWDYTYSSERGVGMQNVIISAAKPFSVLVGFKWDASHKDMTRFDPFGFANSDESGTLIIRVYLGEGDCKFGFISNQNIQDNPLRADICEDNSPKAAAVIFKPHWWQRVGIFA